MKKFISILCVVLTVFALTACGGTECEECRKKIRGKKYTARIMGQEFTICETCNKKYEMMKQINPGLIY